MNPFASLLHDIRIRNGFRQFELADLIGYEQTYISALEVGKKGPPTPEFIDRLISALDLTPQECEQLRDAADASQRKFIIDWDLPQDVFWMMRDLRNQLPELTSKQIHLICFALDLKDSLKKQHIVVTGKLKRRIKESKQEATM